ncbi:MAG: sulfoxide reductase heme-binding subunit YedZ [Betaproteobacteria bacterium]|nr:sulfoxide reductase heme-binding subunit YedZ [Betaproteobacteria bacterium]
MFNPSARQLSVLKVITFALCLAPLARLVWGALDDTLGANPIEFITRSLGTWALNFLLITLTVSPLRKLSGWNWLLRLRRMLGLFAFFYVVLHLTTYLWLDQFFDLQAIAKDILKRPFITVGMSAFVLLIPLALTSNNAMIKRLGGKRWQKLHRAVYAIGILGVLHYWWMVKLDTTLPQVYAVLLALLLGIRAIWREQERRRQLAGNSSLPSKPHGKNIPITAKQ